MLKINPRTGRFIAVGRIRRSSSHDVAALRGEACPSCGVAPTFARPIPLPKASGEIEWGVADQPICLSPPCQYRLADELL